MNIPKKLRFYFLISFSPVAPWLSYAAAQRAFFVLGRCCKRNDKNLMIKIKLLLTQFNKPDMIDPR